VSAYHKFQVDMAVLYGADKARAEKEMKEAFDFEVALANVRLKFHRTGMFSHSSMLTDFSDA
jgi:hypothetical protein